MIAQAVLEQSVKRTPSGKDGVRFCHFAMGMDSDLKTTKGRKENSKFCVGAGDKKTEQSSENSAPLRDICF